MRRIALIAVGLSLLGGFWALASGAGGSTPQPTYWVEVDNAFGLVSGADVKVAGVRAGSISGFRLDRKTYHALVGIKVTQQGFDQFRSDAFCESKPQSLIGEYFLDCQPGANGTPLKSGATIPIGQTASTVAPDLVNNILRLPERDRLRIILNELGAAVAGQGENLNEAIRRAVPALRQTDQVLAILAKQNQVLADLAVKGDAVITPLANNHQQVGRWVQMAGRTATDSAARRTALAQTFQKLPAFLEALRPNMAALGQVADSQTPALRNLNASAGQLTRFFNNLGPFSKASIPAFRALGQASQTGDRALKAANPTIAQLNKFSTQAPEVGKNLSIILRYLDDPAHAVETDPRAAPQHTDGRPNYTGLEALLQYIYDQNQAVNIFDGEHYILKVDAFNNPDCAPYADAATANAGGLKLLQECSGNQIGPTSPGLYGQPDLSDTGVHLPRNAQRAAARTKAGAATSSQAAPNNSAPSGGGASNGGSAPSTSPGGSQSTSPGAGGIWNLLSGGPAPAVQTPSLPVTVPTPPASSSSGPVTNSKAQSGVLNYLLGG